MLYIPPTLVCSWKGEFVFNCLKVVFSLNKLHHPQEHKSPTGDAVAPTRGYIFEEANVASFGTLEPAVHKAAAARPLTQPLTINPASLWLLKGNNHWFDSILQEHYSACESLWWL